MTYLREIVRAPAERLGLYRLAVGTYLTIYLSARLPSAFATATARDASFEPVGLVRWVQLSGPLDPSLAMAIYGLAIVFSACFALGWQFSMSGPLCAGLVFWVTSYKSSFGMLFHSENLFALQALLVGFSSAGNRVSLDSRRARPAQSAGIPAGLPLLSCCLVAIAAYLVAGVAKWKLSGFGFVTGETLRVQVAYDNVRKLEFASPHSPLGVYFVRHAWVFPILGFITMVAELGGPLSLLHRRLAQIWVALLISFHFGVLALMAITFSYPMSGVPFLCFFSLEKSRLGHWLGEVMEGRASKRRNR